MIRFRDLACRKSPAAAERITVGVPGGKLVALRDQSGMRQLFFEVPVSHLSRSIRFLRGALICSFRTTGGAIRRDNGPAHGRSR